MHEYEKRLGVAIKRGVIDRGTAAYALVRHDMPQCAIYSGGHCNCNPDIIIRTDKGDLFLGPDGMLTPSSEVSD